MPFGPVVVVLVVLVVLVVVVVAAVVVVVVAVVVVRSSKTPSLDQGVAERERRLPQGSHVQLHELPKPQNALYYI